MQQRFCDSAVHGAPHGLSCGIAAKNGDLK